MPHGEDMEYVEPRKTTFERHLQSILAALVVMIAGWIAFNVSDNLQATARMEVRIENMQNKLIDLEASLRDAPSASDMRDLQRLIADHETRIRALERQLRIPN